MNFYSGRRNGRLLTAVAILGAAGFGFFVSNANAQRYPSLGDGAEAEALQPACLPDWIDFLNKAARNLKRDGKIIATEPYLSTLSTLIFKYLHHEPVDFDIAEPVLSEVQGPLTSANSAFFFVPCVFFA